MEGVNWFNVDTPLVDEAITSAGHKINFHGHIPGDVNTTFDNSVPGFTSGGVGNIYFVRPEQTDDISIRNVSGSAQVLRVFSRTAFSQGEVIGILGTTPGNFTFGGTGSESITMVLGTGAETKYARITNQASNGSKLTIGDKVTFLIGGGTEANLQFEGAGDIDFLGIITGDQAGAPTRNLTKIGAGTLLLAGDNSDRGDNIIGTVAINSGTLAVGHNNALGAGTVTIANNARLAANASARTINNTITNTNGAILGQTGAGRLTLAGDWITSDARLLTVQDESRSNRSTGELRYWHQRPRFDWRWHVDYLQRSESTG